MIRHLLIIFLVCSGINALAQVHVRGYTRSNGTYVQPHERTRPNHTVTDNYSYPGNYNPNKGEVTGGSAIERNSASPPATTTGSGNYQPAIAPSYSEPISVPTPSIATQVPTKEAVTANQLYAETESNAALKTKPSYMANSTYAIPKGARVKITKYDENYYRAEVDGRTGYVCTCQVKRTYSGSNR